MKKPFAVAIGFVFLAVLALGVTYAQQTTAGTGDRKFDGQLRRLNEEAKADPEGFLHSLSLRHNVPEEEIRQAKQKNGLDDAEIYMSTVLARMANRRVGDVAAEYKQNKGQGWGVMAMRMGIKPGSPAFKRMKADAKYHSSQMKARAKNKRKMREQDMKRAKQQGRKIKGEDEGQGKGKKK